MRSDSMHPGTWWLLGISIVASAMVADNHLALLSLCVLAICISAWNGNWVTWKASMRLYLFLAIAVFVTRLVFRIVFSYSGADQQIVVDLPELEIYLGFGQAVTLLGPVSQVALWAATADGLRLAAIVLGVGLANTLANPRKLLKSTPGALYEIATAVAIAVNLAPQLAQSIQRVRRAGSLRGRSKKLKSINSLLIPILEDTIESSLKLSASMDARGFGRRGNLTAKELSISRGAALLGIVFIAVGIFLLLTTGHSVGMWAVGLGLILAFVSIRITSRKNIRTVMTPNKIRAKDFVVIFTGVALFLVTAGPFQ